MLKQKTMIKNNRFGGRLSITPPQNAILSIAKMNLQNSNETKTETKNQLMVKTKKILKVYIVHESKTKFIDQESAEELQLIRKNVRHVLIDREIKYEITDGIIESIKSSKGPVDIEIEYVELPPIDKQTCNIYYYDHYKFIDMSAAFALGFVDAKTFHNSDEKFEISEKQYEIIKNKFKLNLINTRLAIQEKEEELTC